MASIYEDATRFINLFGGYADFKSAFGTGKGQWVKRPLRPDDVLDHLQGKSVGIGLPPLRPDNKVLFAAIDLDEPDFEAAREMQTYLPGVTWLERSRSGNAHVWAFFSDPIEAWVPMGVMREACVAAGKPKVEVFPKNYDFARVRLGNYINLPYHGDQRPIYRLEREPFDDHWHPDLQAAREHDATFLPLDEFLECAAADLNDPEDWHGRARWLMIEPPDSRQRVAEFGKQHHLHICAEHIIANAEDNPITEGHRAVVYFNLAKMLTNWEMCDHDEALEILRSVNEASPDRIDDRELRRILSNAENGQYTSTGCDDPLFAPYAHPDCPIARRA